jgi:hypothetical protein
MSDALSVMGIFSLFEKNLRRSGMFLNLVLDRHDERRPLRAEDPSVHAPQAGAHRGKPSV